MDLGTRGLQLSNCRRSLAFNECNFGRIQFEEGLEKFQFPRTIAQKIKILLLQKAIAWNYFQISTFSLI